MHIEMHVDMLCTMFCRISTIVSVSTALHSLSQAHMTGGPVDLSHQLPYVLQSLVRHFYTDICIPLLGFTPHVDGV